jgi:hypothetical protein
MRSREADYPLGPRLLREPLAHGRVLLPVP